VEIERVAPPASSDAGIGKSGAEGKTEGGGRENLMNW
jgi:hypothetical protein